MLRFLSVFVLLVGVGSSPAQQPQAVPLRFSWKAGQTLAFLVTQSTTVTESLADEGKPTTTGTTATKLTLRRQWTVKDVDAAGTATLEMAITAFRQETRRTGPGKEGRPATTTEVLDSATPADREKLPFLGKTMVTAKVDGRGQVVDVKSEAGDAAAARLKAELPFRIALPADAVAPGAKWDRPFAIRIDPPQGTGEVYDLTQSATFRGVNDGFAVIAVATSLKAPPTNSSELLPLVPSLWEGDVFINLQTGSYAGAKFTIRKEIPNHQGEGSKFGYASEYSEAVADGK